jgi:hypothetical protein
MITALVQFRLPQPVTREKAQQLFVGSAPKYREASGLIRKYYLLSEDGGTAGGVYLWKSKKDAAGSIPRSGKTSFVSGTGHNRQLPISRVRLSSIT